MEAAEIEVFPARDALVLKALALVLERRLPVSRRCTHVRGHGGAKAALRRVAARLRRLPFVLRTDVRGYYASIDPVKLVERLARFVPDQEVLRLVAQMTARTSERGGLHRDSGGLPLGCSLSPLLGALYLGELGLEKHPDKTFIGRVERGFDFLGYRLSPQGLRVAKQTLERFAVRAARLQERERAGRAPPGALGAYVRRWLGWASGGWNPSGCEASGSRRNVGLRAAPPLPAPHGPPGREPTESERK